MINARADIVELFREAQGLLEQKLHRVWAARTAPRPRTSTAGYCQRPRHGLGCGELTLLAALREEPSLARALRRTCQGGRNGLVTARRLESRGLLALRLTGHEHRTSGPRLRWRAELTARGHAALEKTCKIMT